MYKNVAGIMHMGEMKFKQRQREEQAEVDTEDGQWFGFYCEVSYRYFSILHIH